MNVRRIKTSTRFSLLKATGTPLATRSWPRIVNTLIIQNGRNVAQGNTQQLLEKSLGGISLLNRKEMPSQGKDDRALLVFAEAMKGGLLIWRMVMRTRITKMTLI